MPKQDEFALWIAMNTGKGGGGGGTTDYNALSNKPKINGVELVGNKTSADLKIEGATYTAGEGIDITNNEISVDNTIARKNDLSNYYNKTEVDTLLNAKQDTLTKADILNILGYEEQTLAITDDNNVTTTRKILVETPAPTHLIDEDVTLTFDNSSLENINIEVSELETQPSIIRVACTNTAFMGDSVIPPSDWTAELTKTGASFIYNGGEWRYAFAPTLHQMMFLVGTNDGTNITGTFTAHVTIDIVE